jgi:light-regulated signal transduction histidine kinase (bacteriophytochrome)
MASFSQLLAERYKSNLDNDAKDFIGFIEDAANRMQSLIVDLLAYSRIGRAGSSPGRVDCNAALETVVAGLGRQIEESGAVITHDSLPLTVYHERELVQLFQNLIGNAVKFRGADPPRVHVGAERRDSGWMFFVRDNGIGIDNRFKERIFQIFRRLHGRGQYPGTGIGLSICKKIVEAHGGRIWVESAPGEGSTFFFTIPDKT